MKRSIFKIMLILSLCFALSGCSSGQREVRQIATYRIRVADSVDSLQRASDLIIVFTPEAQENILFFHSDGNVSFGYTKTSGTVSQVLLGDTAEGNSILITEECYTTDDGSVLWTQGGYLPMNIGESYLLFLKAYNSDSPYAGMYYPIELEYGRYVISPIMPLSGEDAQDQTYLEIGDATDLDTYLQWYAEVRELYPDLF